MQNLRSLPRPLGVGDYFCAVLLVVLLVVLVGVVVVVVVVVIIAVECLRTFPRPLGLGDEFSLAVPRPGELRRPVGEAACCGRADGCAAVYFPYGY